MDIKQKYGNMALIAGASEGLGAAYAEALAALGFDLFLIARRKDKLEETRNSIRDRFGVTVSCLPCDLSESTAAEQIQDAVGSTEINFLVYNAAVPYIGPYLDLPIDCHIRIASANMITPLKLVHYFGSRMITKRKGGIVLMSSLAGLQGSGFIATYAATKAFNLILAESLWYEWKDKGVDIIGCCAGATATPNYIKSKPGKLGLFAPRTQTPQEVVNECIHKIGKRPSFISGNGNKLASFFMRRFISRKMAVTIMGDTTRKLYKIDYSFTQV